MIQPAWDQHQGRDNREYWLPSNETLQEFQEELSHSNDYSALRRTTGVDLICELFDAKELIAELEDLAQDLDDRVNDLEARNQDLARRL